MMNGEDFRGRDTPTEKQVEHACDELMKSLGWSVVRFSQPRNTMQSPGIPDRRYYPSAQKVERYGWSPFWMEVKRPGGTQSEYQRAFERMCDWSGDLYVLGGIPELVKYLNDTGIQKIKLHA